MKTNISFQSIGTIHTPYETTAPAQPQASASPCSIEISKEFEKGLYKLNSFNTIMVFFYLDQNNHYKEHSITPPWISEGSVGVFASRSPDRPNPLGLSIVSLYSIENNILNISSIDAFNNTPVLDIKPYIPEIDLKPDANSGWLNDSDAKKHLLQHLQGIVHEH